MRNYETAAKKAGFDIVVGVDEAGRGPLAGPVVAGAVFLKTPRFKNKIADSKTISPQAREDAFHEIFDKAYVGIGMMNEEVIDRVNILQATFLAMTNAVEDLMAKIPSMDFQQTDNQKKICLLIDGPHFKSDLPYAFRTIVDGDSHVLSIACASIVAKVIRDRILNCYDQIYPQYGFKQHKGYPTPQHKKALRQFGPSMIHRKTFRY